MRCGRAVPRRPHGRLQRRTPGRVSGKDYCITPLQIPRIMTVNTASRIAYRLQYTWYSLGFAYRYMIRGWAFDNRPVEHLASAFAVATRCRSQIARRRLIMKPRLVAIHGDVSAPDTSHLALLPQVLPKRRAVLWIMRQEKVEQNGRARSKLAVANVPDA